MMRSRLETLRWLYKVAEDALEEAPADRKSALIGQLRGISADIDAIEGDKQEPTEKASNPLEEMLARRNRTAS